MTYTPQQLARGVERAMKYGASREKSIEVVAMKSGATIADVRASLAPKSQ